MNYQAQSQVRAARNDAMAAERIRQQGFDREADAINLTSRGRYEGYEEKQDAKTSSLAEMFRGSAEQSPEAIAEAPIPVSSSNVVNMEQNKQKGKAQAYGEQQADALGSLRAFGDLLGGIGREQARDAMAVGQIGGFKKGSSSVLGYELEEANDAGSDKALFGDILSGLGKVGVSAGIGGGTYGAKAPGAPLDLSVGMRSLPTFARGAQFNPWTLAYG